MKGRNREKGKEKTREGRVKGETDQRRRIGGPRERKITIEKRDARKNQS